MNGCAVVDFEAFKDVNNDFIIKELAVVDVVHGLSRVVLFKPPYAKTKLDRKCTRVADWLEENRHGMAWTGGYVDYAFLVPTITDVCAPYSTVFTKGVEKVRFLSVYHPNVKDLTEINAPKYDDTIVYGDVSCPVMRHAFVARKDEKYVYKCALRKSQFFAKWLRTNGQDLGIICKTCGQLIRLHR